ncbi:MAG: Fe-S cluster assembly sulfur transfer protein SufU [Magnetovibrionaceae bacterium]
MDGLGALYQESILDHGKNPRNRGTVENVTAEALGANPNCGDRISVSVSLEGETITDVAFDGQGCAISMASASMMTEVVKGVEAKVAERLFSEFRRLCTEAGDVELSHDGLDGDLVEQLRVMAGVRQFPGRIKCATLSWAALEAALQGRDQASSE